MLVRPFFMCLTTLLVPCVFFAAAVTEQERIDDTVEMLSKPGWPKYLSEIQLELDGNQYNIEGVQKTHVEQASLKTVIEQVHGLLACYYAVTLRQLMVYEISIELFLEPEATPEEESAFTSSFIETIESAYLLIARMHKSLNHVRQLAPETEEDEHYMSRALDGMRKYIENIRSDKSHSDYSGVVSTLSGYIIVLDAFTLSCCKPRNLYAATEIDESSQEQIEREIEKIIRKNIVEVLPSLGIV